MVHGHVVVHGGRVVGVRIVGDIIFSSSSLFRTVDGTERYLICDGKRKFQICFVKIKNVESE